MIAIISLNAHELYKITPIIDEMEQQALKYTIIQTQEEDKKEEVEEALKELKIQKNVELLTLGRDKSLIKLIQKIMIALKKVQANNIIVINNTRLSLAAALAARELSLPVIHIEAGLRSFDNSKERELNSKMIDSIANLLFAPSQRALINLYYEGIEPNRTFFCGTTLIQMLNKINNVKNSRLQNYLEQFLGGEDSYIFFSIDTEFSASISDIEQIAMKIVELKKKFVLALEPKVKEQISQEVIEMLQKAKNVLILEDRSYVSKLQLINNDYCEMTITTSYALQLEAFLMRKPCIIINRSTFWPEPLEYGTSYLVRPLPAEIQKKINNIETNKRLREIFDYAISEQPYGDTSAAKKIVNTLQKNLKHLHFSPEEFYKYGSRTYLLIFIKNIMIKEEIEEQYNCTITLVYDDAGAPIPIPKVLYPGYRVRVILK